MEKYILITGTGRGIGLALVKEFLQNSNIQVLALSRSARPGCIPASDRLRWLQYDDTMSRTEPEYYYKLISGQITKLDVLINNAAIYENKPYMVFSRQESEYMMNINYHFAAELIRQTIPLLQKTVKPQVINISSMAGFAGSIKFAGTCHYAASKAALHALTEVLAVEYPAIGFNALALGAVQTEMFNKAFPGAAANMTPEEIAKFVVGFALHGASLFNGKILPVSRSTP